nr:hypothetical protein [Tanacetum cinerariifolium]
IHQVKWIQGQKKIQNSELFLWNLEGEGNVRLTIFKTLTPKQQVLLLDNEIAFNDLAVLIHKQRAMIGAHDFFPVHVSMLCYICCHCTSKFSPGVETYAGPVGWQIGQMMAAQMSKMMAKMKNGSPVARTPEQNGVFERRNRTLVEAARTMLSAAFQGDNFWAEAIATACFTQNRSLVIPRHEKTPYHIINDWKPSVKFFHIFGSLCYMVRDGENLDKMKEKGNACIFVGYSTQSRAYRVFNKRKRVIMETIHVNFDEFPQMTSDHISSDPGPQCQRTELEHVSLSPVPTQAPTVTSTENINQAETIEEYAHVQDDEFINIFCTPVQDRGETSSHHVDSSNMHTFYQHHPSKHRWTKDHPLEQVTGNPSQSVRTRRQLESDGEMCKFTLTSKAYRVFNKRKRVIVETIHVNFDEFPQMTSDHVSSDPGPQCQRTELEHVSLSPDHPLEQVTGNPSQSVRTRRQLESDGEMCKFTLTVSQTEPKNIKEAMDHSAWIESILEELHQFDRLDVWELVNRPLCQNVINMKWL